MPQNPHRRFYLVVVITVSFVAFCITRDFLLLKQRKYVDSDANGLTKRGNKKNRLRFVGTTVLSQGHHPIKTAEILNGSRYNFFETLLFLSVVLLCWCYILYYEYVVAVSVIIW